MRRTILILAAFFLISLAYGQETTIIFYPNGKPYKGVSKTIGQLHAEFEEHSRVYEFHPPTDPSDNLTSVTFKLFTDEPLWILIEDSTKIQDAIKSFNLNAFLHSWEFEFELENYIKEGTLSDIFIIETLGHPDKKTKYFDQDIQVDSWTYLDLGVTLIFRNGIVRSYISNH